MKKSACNRTVEELKQSSVGYWTEEILRNAQERSLVPLLLRTQDKFLSILKIADKSPDAWKHALALTDGINNKIFLKHLMVLSDVGSEVIKRFQKDFEKIFPMNRFTFIWKEQRYQYIFKVFGDKHKKNTTYQIMV